MTRTIMTRTGGQAEIQTISGTLKDIFIYSVEFKIESNSFYFEPCKDENGSRIVFENETDALNYGIDYVTKQYGIIHTK